MTKEERISEIINGLENLRVSSVDLPEGEFLLEKLRLNS